MALGIQTQSNDTDFLARIQYDARAGRFFRIDREQDGAGAWINNSEELPMPLRLGFDMDNLEVGWIRLAGAVDFKMVTIGQPLPPDPGLKDDKGQSLYRQGFRVKVYNKNLGVRHWNHTAKCVLEQVDALHDAWMSQHAANPGKVPIVTIEKAVARVSGKGAKQSTNYAPLMAITDWLVRPEGFEAPATNGHANGNGHAPAAQKQVAQHVAPPPAAMPKQLEPAGADAPEF